MDRIKTIFTCRHNREGCPYCAHELLEARRDAVDEYRAKVALRENVLMYEGGESINTVYIAAEQVYNAMFPKEK